LEIINVCVGSTNPVKIEAVELAFSEVFKNHTVKCFGINTDSQVSDQPMGNDETLLGAKNRANHAKLLASNNDFFVGIEGGNIRISKTEMETMAWIYVVSKNQHSKARTAGFYLPITTIKLIDQGYELGKADEITFGIENSKQKMGSSGLLTNNIITRSRFYKDAIILALIPFIMPQLYPIKN
jgi:inosine/xanthosine triphosphatase